MKKIKICITLLCVLFISSCAQPTTQILESPSTEEVDVPIVSNDLKDHPASEDSNDPPVSEDTTDEQVSEEPVSDTTTDSSITIVTKDDFNKFDVTIDGKKLILGELFNIEDLDFKIISDTYYSLTQPISDDEFKVIKYNDFELYLEKSSFGNERLEFEHDYIIRGIKIFSTYSPLPDEIKIGQSKVEIIDKLINYDFEKIDNDIILINEAKSLKLVFDENDTLSSMIIKDDFFEELVEPDYHFLSKASNDPLANYIFVTFYDQWAHTTNRTSALLLGYTSGDNWYTFDDLEIDSANYRFIHGFELNNLYKDKKVFFKTSKLDDNNSDTSITDIGYTYNTCDYEKIWIAFDEISIYDAKAYIGTTTEITTPLHPYTVTYSSDNITYTIDLDNDGKDETIIPKSISVSGGKASYTESNDKNVHTIYLADYLITPLIDVQFIDLNNDGCLEIICSSRPFDHVEIYEYKNNELIKRLSYYIYLN